MPLKDSAPDMESSMGIVKSRLRRKSTETCKVRIFRISALHEWKLGPCWMSLKRATYGAASRVNLPPSGVFRHDFAPSLLQVEPVKAAPRYRVDIGVFISDYRVYTDNNMV